jgi:hypothetical protein
MNCNTEDVPPPGGRFITETFNVPACAKPLAGIAAWISVVLTYVVGNAVPLIKTVEDALKLDPVTFRLSAALPAAALAGERRLPCGTGLFTVNETTVDGRLPGFATITSGVPATAIALAGIAAWTTVGL